MNEVPPSDPTSTPIVAGLFDRLGAQLTALATGEQATSEQLRTAADGASDDQAKQATAAAAAEYAARAEQVTELAATVGGIRAQALSDLGALLALAASVG